MAGIPIFFIQINKLVFSHIIIPLQWWADGGSVEFVPLMVATINMYYVVGTSCKIVKALTSYAHQLSTKF